MQKQSTVDYSRLVSQIAFFFCLPEETVGPGPLYTKKGAEEVERSTGRNAEQSGSA